MMFNICFYYMTMFWDAFHHLWNQEPCSHLPWWQLQSCIEGGGARCRPLTSHLVQEVGWKPLASIWTGVGYTWIQVHRVWWLVVYKWTYVGRALPIQFDYRQLNNLLSTVWLTKVLWLCPHQIRTLISLCFCSDLLKYLSGACVECWNTYI